MNIEEVVADIFAQQPQIPPDQKLSYIKEQLRKITNPAERQLAESLIEIGISCGAEIKKQIVVLLHGIRTQATWQEMVVAELENIPNITIYPIGYGYLDAFRFWCPFYFRKPPVERVLREVRGIRAKHADANISVIAHSFGTYITTQILSHNSDVVLDRLILCGSVIPTDFRWDMVPTFPKGGVINEVGTKDGWPVAAMATSWGYGCSGTFGFKTHSVKDRYHDYKHSDFFHSAFIQQYWIPYFTSGKVVASEWGAKRPSPPLKLSLLAIVPLKSIVLLFIITLVVWMLLKP